MTSQLLVFDLVANDGEAEDDVSGDAGDGIVEPAHSLDELDE
jgi:hypothetical protein